MLAVAREIAEQPAGKVDDVDPTATVQRNQEKAKDGVGKPRQVPGDKVKVEPTVALPVMLGGVAFIGAAVT